MGAGRRVLKELRDTAVRLKSSCAISDLHSCKILADVMECKQGLQAGVLREASTMYHYMPAGTLVFPKENLWLLPALLT